MNRQPRQGSKPSGAAVGRLPRPATLALAAAAAITTWAAGQPASAQFFGGSRLIEDFQIWNRATFRGDLGDGNRWNVEVESRLTDGASFLRQFFIRPSIVFPISNRFSLAVGIGVFARWDLDPLNNPENRLAFETRLFQDANYNHDLAPFNFSHRLRLEERFLPGTNDITLRARYRLQLQRPLDEGGIWSFVLGNEAFYTANTPESAFNVSSESPAGSFTGTAGGFTENRVSFSLVNRLSRNMSLELGYIGQFTNGFGPGDRFNSALLTNITYDFNPPAR